MELSHGRRLHRFFSYRLRTGPAEAQDLVQEVYLRLLRVEEHEAIRNAQAYLYTIANHVLYQYALRNAAKSDGTHTVDAMRDVEQMPDVDEMPDMSAAEATDPEALVDSEQRLEALGKALEEYSPRAYATLILHRCDGIPLRDIAERFGVSYSMAKRYLAQAIQFCERVLDEEAR